jgi:tetraacyldisaccharide 4'-kinase
MMDWAEIHNRKGFTPLAALFAPLSIMYGMAVQFRVKCYPDSRRRSLPGFVVSIGNLTVGGTGKTPAAIMIAEWAVSQGYRPAILSRGYGGKRQTDALEVSDGHRVLSSAAEAGDEPHLMAKRLPGVPVIVSRQRYVAGLLAHKKHGTNFFILDDGFQHIALRRDLDLALIDVTTPFGNERLLPWGPLREPIEQLGRADAFILTRVDDGSAKENTAVIELLKKRFPEKPIFMSRHVPEKIVFPDGNKVYNVDFLQGKRIAAFAGIARPEVFKKTLADLGAEVVSFAAFRDHQVFTPREIADLVEEKKRVGADYLATTEKDWARLENVVAECPDLAYLSIRLVITEGAEIFFGMLKEKSSGQTPG